MSNSYRVQRVETGGCDVDHLFLSRQFNEFQAHAQRKVLASFGAVHEATGKLAACLTLAGSEGNWSSPVTGAFGGIAMLEGVPTHVVETIAANATTWLKADGARSCRVRLPPQSFQDSATAILQNVLFRAGWRLENVDLNFHLLTSSPDQFFASLNETKQKEIRRLKRAGTVFAAVPTAEAQPVYDVIAKNRVHLGHPMTMSWPAVVSLANAFQERVKFFGAFRGEEILAGAICLSIAKHYLYVFYWGDAPQYRKESPVMCLAEGIVAYSNQAGISVIDLGTSSDASKPDEGLISFKRSLGCSTTTKATFRLDL